MAEALANAAKHAQATVVEVSGSVRDGQLALSLRDNGVGGADPARGSGLTSLTDRVAALGGAITITSPPRRGTTIQVRLPLSS